MVGMRKVCEKCAECGEWGARSQGFVRGRRAAGRTANRIRALLSYERQEEWAADLYGLGENPEVLYLRFSHRTAIQKQKEEGTEKEKGRITVKK